MTKHEPRRWAQKKRKNESYRKTARLRLAEMLKAGLNSKRSHDKPDDNTKNKIYSDCTFKTYKSQFRYFADWLEETHSEAKTIDDARMYVDEYLQHLIDLNKSAYSISTAKASLAKVFMTSASEFIETPIRTRANITRSRNVAVRDKGISERTEEALARFTSATGLRRAEMTKIRANDLFFQNGTAYLNVSKGTKGGKHRVVEVVGQTEEETKHLIKWIQSKRGRLFPELHSHYDNHYYRAVYAKRVYQKYARSEDDIPRSERYIMRKDRAGEVYDKPAMMIASRNLGHNRISVIAQSYLY